MKDFLFFIILVILALIMLIFMYWHTNNYAYAGVLPWGTKTKIITGYDWKDTTQEDETFKAIDIGFEVLKYLT